MSTDQAMEIFQTALFEGKVYRLQFHRLWKILQAQQIHPRILAPKPQRRALSQGRRPLLRRAA